MLQQYNGKFKSFCRRPPAHVEKLQIAFQGRHATREMSFAPGMIASHSNVNERMKGLEVDTRVHVGDSDDGDSGGTPDDVDFIPPVESRSPSKTMSCGRKRKSVGGMSSGSKRQACGGSSTMEEEVSNALHILRMREEARQGPLLSQLVSARLRNHPDIGQKHPDFIFHILDHIVTEKQEQYFLGLDEDFLVPYVRLRGFDI